VNSRGSLVRNISWGWLGFGYSVFLTFFTTPWILDSIGVEAYGVWLLLQSVVGYYGFIDMGLRASLTQSITTKLAKNDIEGVKRFVGTAVPVMFRLGLIVVLLSFVIGAILPVVVQVSPGLRQSIWIVVVVQAIAVAVNLVSQPFTAVTIGLQRYDLAEVLAIITRTIWALSLIVSLSMSGTLLVLAVVTLANALLEAWIRYLRTIYLLPELRTVQYRYNKEDLKELKTKGFWNFMVQISHNALGMASPLIVGMMFSPSAVVPFATAASLLSYGAKFVSQPTRMLYPALVYAEQRKQGGELQSLFFNACRFVVWIAISYGIAVSVWSGIFLRLWLGEKAEYSNVFQDVESIFLILASAFVVTAFRGVGNQLLMSKNQLSFMAKSCWIEAVPSLILGVLFGYWWGPKGVAMGGVVPLVLVGLWLHVPRYIQVLDITITALVKNLALYMVSFAVALFTSLMFYKDYCPEIVGWSSFFCYAFLPTAALILALSPLALGREMIMIGLRKFSHQITKRIFRVVNV
jgi:O-antigen/teichoic acid export membrane protein